MKNYYKILDIPVTASPDQVKEAYDRKSVQYYRDRDISTEDFFDIKEAYYSLSSRYKRESYDKEFSLHFPEFSQQEDINEAQLADETFIASCEDEGDSYIFVEEIKEIEVEKDNDSKTEFKVKIEKADEENIEVDRTVPDYTLAEWLPRKDHWGTNLSVNIDFFKLPKNIGKILSAYSTLTKDKLPPTHEKTIQICAVWTCVGFGLAVILTNVLDIYNTKLFIFLRLMIPACSCAIGYVRSRFQHTNTYVGTNGFAKFKCRDSRKNIMYAFELNFNQVTALIRTKEVVNSHKGAYQQTNYAFIWLDNEDIAEETKGSYSSKSDDPPKRKTDYWLHHFAEASWTTYLLNHMQKEIDDNEEIEFTLYRKDGDMYTRRAAIRLGADYMTFVLPDREKKCLFKEARRIYAKDDILHVEYMNYKKKFIFLDEGNKDKISLNYLGNREIFYKVLEKRLGSKLAT